MEYVEVLGGVESEHFVEFKRLMQEGFKAARKHCDSIVSKLFSLPCNLIDGFELDTTTLS